VQAKVPKLRSTEEEPDSEYSSPHLRPLCSSFQEEETSG
jgi:hypothetical protein